MTTATVSPTPMSLEDFPRDEMTVSLGPVADTRRAKDGWKAVTLRWGLDIQDRLNQRTVADEPVRDLHVCVTFAEREGTGYIRLSEPRQKKTAYPRVVRPHIFGYVTRNAASYGSYRDVIIQRIPQWLHESGHDGPVEWTYSDEYDGVVAVIPLKQTNGG